MIVTSSSLSNVSIASGKGVLSGSSCLWKECAGEISFNLPLFNLIQVFESSNLARP